VAVTEHAVVVVEHLFRKLSFDSLLLFGKNERSTGSGWTMVVGATSSTLTGEPRRATG
jgi:hypothetical protein